MKFVLCITIKRDYKLQKYCGLFNGLETIIGRICLLEQL